MQTIESQLSELRLSGMKKSWQAIVETRRQHDLNLVEGIEILLDAELIERGNRRTSRLTKMQHSAIRLLSNRYVTTLHAVWTSL